MSGCGASEGNSLSLSGVCGRSTQSPLPRAARRRRSRGREGAGYHETHVVWAFAAAAGKPLSARGARKFGRGDSRVVVLRCGLWSTPSASRQLPREGAGYHRIHVAGVFSAADRLILLTRYPGSTTPRLPRGGRVGRVLAAVDAVTACSA